MNGKKLYSTIFALFIAAAATLSARAQTPPQQWPQKQIRWIVGFTPGGTADVLTRIAAKELSERIDRPVIVENRPGASGAVALQYVTHTAPSELVLITVPGPIVYPKPEPTIGGELTPVILMAQGPMIIVGPARNSENSLAGVIDNARKHPQAWSYATSGTGTSQNLAGELLNDMAKTHMTQIPYKGGSQAVSDVVGGQVPLAILGPTPVAPHIRSKALKAYAVTTTYRLSSLPDVPTVQEAGFPGYDASQWFAVATVKGAPDDRIKQLNLLLGKAVATAQFQKALAVAGMVAGGGSPEDLQKFVNDDTRKWSKLIQKAGLSVTN
ncbi:tripartite tricarboxylate transporter substrate binding protein [Paralcaligenes sp. KSB-10]|uniref:Bug family tripartite tricarboxylate transporter substrate binding protein n=1 Tax=Paralcaligenes sp. KSB-10 TaxID=2901142 RepID=UPI001E4FB0BD|nr:tripartite tricarboxylate transporter substrate-binding protein [Paralcaligenes sp. KSB-10]UHL65082.1 tripartite tricarboxylate transporter substrate binding protein [Paralcaligenes sp. KSB-10]